MSVTLPVTASLGQNRLGMFWRVTGPLVTPGLTAAFCPVFLSAVTELTATLILVPTGVQTLATQFWNDQQNVAYGQAAPFALLMIAIAAVPSYVLGGFFDRRTLTTPKLLRRRGARLRRARPGYVDCSWRDPVWRSGIDQSSSPSPRATSQTDTRVIVGSSGRGVPPAGHVDARDRKTRPPTAHNNGPCPASSPPSSTAASQPAPAPRITVGSQRVAQPPSRQAAA